MREPNIFLMHILDEINYILSRSTNLEYQKFLIDEDLKRSFVRSLEIIGEAAKNLDEVFRKKHPQIEWKKIGGLRDVLIHHYFGINYERVWDVVKNKVPELKDQIEKILDAFKSS